MCHFGHRMKSVVIICYGGLLFLSFRKITVRLCHQLNSEAFFLLSTTVQLRNRYDHFECAGKPLEIPKVFLHHLFCERRRKNFPTMSESNTRTLRSAPPVNWQKTGEPTVIRRNDDRLRPFFIRCSAESGVKSGKPTMKHL